MSTSRNRDCSRARKRGTQLNLCLGQNRRTKTARRSHYSFAARRGFHTPARAALGCCGEAQEERRIADPWEGELADLGGRKRISALANGKSASIPTISAPAALGSGQRQCPAQPECCLTSPKAAL